MLSSFYIQNFRSILDLKMNFSYDEGKAPNGYKDNEIMPFIEAAKDVTSSLYGIFRCQRLR